jgi:hypothetical protein
VGEFKQTTPKSHRITRHARRKLRLDSPAHDAVVAPFDEYRKFQLTPLSLQCLLSKNLTIIRVMTTNLAGGCHEPKNPHPTFGPPRPGPVAEALLPA